jgi:hypothetical protein
MKPALWKMKKVLHEQVLIICFTPESTTLFVRRIFHFSIFRPLRQLLTHAFHPWIHSTHRFSVLRPKLKIFNGFNFRIPRGIPVTRDGFFIEIQ